MRQLKIPRQITNRKGTTLDKYLLDISKIALITSDEEIELAEKIRLGDQDALKTMVNANLRFVVSVAKQYQYQGLPLSDLINEGNLGLIKAAGRFDPTRGFKFISYAVWWIRQAIIQAVSENSRMVRLPLNKIGMIGKINQAVIFLEQTFERKPSPEEISDFLEVSLSEIETCLLNSRRNLSLDSPLKNDEDQGNSLYTVIEAVDSPVPDDNLLNMSLRTDIANLLNVLSVREKEIMIKFYGLQGNSPKRLEDIATSMDLTRERVRQIKGNALQQLKASRISSSLLKYL
ncbi:sigma-70 family RNA polymerase sigma factor [Sinomicrobium soli]|uniref:sigma-70 family RNA polymerase sigma factor n=1 Tax=Sinomicrobium sp. N-1-3-6 TaxID=2219864 RepID=UPI000DCEF1C5|nr:RNA polymerase sigma factor RpoD/SigA [Sinomicrobium sp. N-1-3-6]RAV30958.1 RNA polymerase subunit sigma [Sinomicrobium sp. N-1-3-6]